ncbi:MAG TPA: S9 family peptidase [Gammaproteobacteria bacterium]|nr:S9 family peptidase [Gammaproteobacteria bacterium]
MSRNLLPGLVLCLAAGGALAENAAPIPVEAFFSYSKVSSAKISPDGKFLAMVVSDDDTGEDRKFLAIIGTDDRKFKTGFKVADGNVIDSYWWANDERVLVATATETGGLSVASLDGALYAINLDASQPRQLLGESVGSNPVNKPQMRTESDNFTHIQHKDGPDPHAKHYFYSMLYIPPHDAHRILVKGWSSDGDGTQALDVDIYTGDVKAVVKSPVRGWTGFLTDADGNIRVAWGTRNYDGSRQLFYRDAGDSADWKDLSALFKGADAADDDVGPIMMAQDGKTFYWHGRTPDSTLGIYRVNPADMAVTDLFSDPVFDVETYFIGDYANNRHDILAVETDPGLSELHVIDQKDPEIAVLLALGQAFPGQEVHITSATQDGGLMVVFVGSDRNPGDYYLFNSKTLKADYLFSALDQIDPDKMASMQPVALKTRDGLTLHGYLTTPVGKAAKNLPFILLPHGGPHGIRDYWGWDPEVQFFASRGYAVLQVNFRGSGGYGMKFQDLGYRNWGTTMQDDLADSVQWAVQQGIADPNRICIYGASYGGYAALENVIRYPQLYKCAVGYVGVYDLTLEAKYGDVHRSASGRNYLEIVRGNDTAELKRYSPVFNADKITVPVFIAYGGRDERVVPDNAKELRAAMDAAGKKYVYLFDPYEVHGFRKPEDKFELYTRMIKFIDENVGDAVVKTGAADANKAPPPP